MAILQALRRTVSGPVVLISTINMDLHVVFGQNVRRLREEQGMTQIELASRAGLNRSYLGGVERGQRRICMENIARIADALSISPDVLFQYPVAPKSSSDEG